MTYLIVTNDNAIPVELLAVSSFLIDRQRIVTCTPDGTSPLITGTANSGALDWSGNGKAFVVVQQQG